MIGKVDDILKKNGSKYLVFDSTDENKKIFKKYTDFGMGLKMKLKQQMVVKQVNMEEDLTKIKFDTDDNLPLNKQLKLHMLELNNY